MKKRPILQVGGPTPTLPVIRVVLPHTEACDPTLLQPHCLKRGNSLKYYSTIPECIPSLTFKKSNLKPSGHSVIVARVCFGKFQLSHHFISFKDVKDPDWYSMSISEKKN